MKNSKDIQNSELIATLEGVLGSEVVVTPTALARGLACVVELLRKEIADQGEDEDHGAAQEYATPAQLSKMFGADKATMHRQLRKLQESEDIEVIRFADGEKRSAHPRYKIADVKRALQRASI